MMWKNYLKKALTGVAVTLFFTLRGYGSTFVSIITHEYRPMLKEGKLWNCVEGNENAYSYYSYKLQGDTIIGEKVYKKLLKQHPDINGDSTFYFFAALPEEGRQVYVVRNSLKEELLYDFGLYQNKNGVSGNNNNCEYGRINHGEDIQVRLTNVYSVIFNEGVSTVYSGAVCFQSPQGDDAQTYHVATLLEGIGECCLDPFMSTLSFQPNGILLSCLENGKIIYDLEDVFNIPVVENADYRYGIYDLLLDNTKSWYMLQDKHGRSGRVYALQGDTVINGHRFMQRYSKDYDNMQWKPDGCYIGQDGAKIYYYDRDNGMKQFMNFSLSTGDTITNCFDNQKYIVYHVTDTIVQNSLDQRSRRCLYLKAVDGEELDIWMDGIGSLIHGIIPHNSIEYEGLRMEQCMQDDSLIFKYSPTAVLSLPFSPLHRELVFDLQGRRLTTQPRRGLYIKDGRKHVSH